MNLEELKEKALANGYTKIRLEAEGSQQISLKHWNGVWTGKVGGPGDVNMATVTYHLNGNRVHVQKALEKDILYLLS
jgi:hypothetical protein